MVLYLFFPLRLLSPPVMQSGNPPAHMNNCSQKAGITKRPERPGYAEKSKASGSFFRYGSLEAVTAEKET